MRPILELPRSTIAEYLRRSRQTGLPWTLPAELDEAAHSDVYHVEALGGARLQRPDKAFDRVVPVATPGDFTSSV